MLLRKDRDALKILFNLIKLSQKEIWRIAVPGGSSKKNKMG